MTAPVTARRSLRWRISALASGLVVATLALLGAAAITPVNAGGTGSMIDMGAYWKDPACGTAQQAFVVRIWADTGMTGESWKFCSDLKDFCWAPYGSQSSDALLCDTIGASGDTADDRSSSLRVSAVGGGAACAVAIYEGKNYTGARVKYWDATDVSSLVPWPNDALSSIRREGTGC